MRSLIPEPSFSLQKGPRQTRGDRAEQDGVNHGKRRLCVMRWCARREKEEEEEKKEKEVYSSTAVVRLCRVVSGGEARTRNNTPASYSRWRLCTMTGWGHVVAWHADRYHCRHIPRQRNIFCTCFDTRSNAKAPQANDDELVVYM